MNHQPSECISNLTRPQVKICGLTRIRDAVACVKAGADAIGLVFYPKSPRHLSDERAMRICIGLPRTVYTVGVFVNESFSAIMRRVDCCGLKAVQLHGQESPALAGRLRHQNLVVIKALFIHGVPDISLAADYPASAFLVESGKGPLPGGNALAWDWNAVKDFSTKFPAILAGGLCPDNIARAVSAAHPDAVDISSGVESTPGQKDHKKITALMNALSNQTSAIRPEANPLRRIF